MALQTFTPPVAPQIGGSAPTEFRASEIRYGDGYGDRSGDGLNAESTNVTLVWRTIDPAHVDTIKQFMSDRGGHEAFWYTPPREAAPRKFVCRRMDRRHTKRHRDSLTITLEEVFDL